MPDVEDEKARAADLDLLDTYAREAGRIALGYFQADPQIWTKGDSSPVTEADLAVDAFLRNGLIGERPDLGWLSEETVDDGSRLSHDRLFVVDPIDGTRAFIAGLPDWTVSLAMVENGRPVAAALFCPPRDEMFLAGRGLGARLNGVPLSTGRAATLEGARIAAPKSFVRRELLARAGMEAVPFVHSLAYRLALVACGRIDGAAASGRACDWDLAAADLLVSEAGGRLVELSGGPVRYNAADVRHAPLIASGEALSGPLLLFFSAHMAADGQPRS